jgi:Protein of unknown function (DUF4232)
MVCLSKGAFMILSTRKARRLAAATALACAALVVPAMALAAPSSPVRSASPAGPPPCETPGLVIWLNTNGSGAAGSTFYHLEFTNLSGHSCTLNGFPFLYAVNLSGHQLGRRAGFNGSAHSVTIGKGKTASALLQIVDVQNFGPPLKCQPTTAAGLKVFPPNQTRAKVVPFPFGACGRPAGKGPSFLSVGPVK